MSQGSRPDRVADQLRAELATLLAREVHDPGIGFVTLTRVQVTPDIQQARVFYTALGDEKGRSATAPALRFISSAYSRDPTQLCASGRTPFIGPPAVRVGGLLTETLIPGEEAPFQVSAPPEEG